MEATTKLIHGRDPDGSAAERGSLFTNKSFRAPLPKGGARSEAESLLLKLRSDRTSALWGWGPRGALASPISSWITE